MIGQWLLAILVGVLLSIVLSEPVHWLMSRLPGGIIPARPRSVTGLWLVPYQFEAAGNRQPEKQIVELRQVGKHVFGKTVASIHHRDVIRGIFSHQIYFSGSWRSIKPGQIYHGTFQLIFDPEGERLRGKWLGFSDTYHVVNHGEWEWQLLSRKVRKAEKERIVAQQFPGAAA